VIVEEVLLLGSQDGAVGVAAVACVFFLVVSLLDGFEMLVRVKVGG
jgi:hypothetical protein